MSNNALNLVLNSHEEILKSYQPKAFLVEINDFVYFLFTTYVLIIRYYRLVLQVVSDVDDCKVSCWSGNALALSYDVDSIHLWAQWPNNTLHYL